MLIVVLAVPLVVMPVFVLPLPVMLVVMLVMMIVVMAAVRPVRMLLPQPAAADRPARHARNVLQNQQPRVRRQFAQRPVEERFQARPDPHHQRGRRQHPGVGRAQRVGVRRFAGAQQQPRLGDAGHHAGQQGMHRPDGRHHGRRRSGVRGRAREPRRQRQRAAAGPPARPARRAEFFRGWHR